MITKTMTLTKDLSTDSKLYVPNNSLNFAPDEVIIKGITYFGFSTVYLDISNIFSIKSNLSDEIISTVTPTLFKDPATAYYTTTASINPDIHLKVNPGFTTNIIFEVGTIISVASMHGTVCLTLEFIKH